MIKLSTYSSCYNPLLRLAMPIVASQAGNMMTILADTIMVGKLGDNELAAVSLAGNLSTPILCLGMGVSLCLTPLVSKRLGARQFESIAVCLRHLKTLNIIIGLAEIAIMMLIWFLMPYMGQPEKVVELAQSYMPIIVVSLFPNQMFIGYRQFIEGLNDTKTPMKISIISNVINILFNYIFIYGFWIIDAIGVNGAAWSTLLSRIVAYIAVIIVVHRLTLCRKYYPLARKVRVSRRILKRLSRLGFPIGGQMLVECVAFAFGGIMMGWVGASELAAHEIVMTFTTLTFLMASGISSAITIKVSFFNGQSDPQSMRRYSFASLHLAAIFMTITAILLISLHNIVPQYITDSTNTIAVASSLMIIAGAFQLFDGFQVTALGILRGLGDMTFPPIMSSIAYIFTCLPIGYILTFVVGLGAEGIWFGFFIGLITASTLLFLRLRKKLPH